MVVVSVTRMTASPAPARGLVTSSIPILFFPRKTFASFQPFLTALTYATDSCNAAEILSSDSAAELCFT